MAGGDRIGAKTLRSLQQGRELQVAVAVSARQRCSPRCVLAYEVRDDVLVKLSLEVHDVMRNVEGRRHAPGVVQIVERTAAAERRLAAGLVVELHRQTDNVVALIGEQSCGHRGIDATRHGYDNAHDFRYTTEDAEDAEDQS